MIEFLKGGIDLGQEEVVVLEDRLAEYLAKLMGRPKQQRIALPGGFAEELFLLFIRQTFLRCGGIAFGFLVLATVGFAPILDELFQLRADGSGVLE